MVELLKLLKSWKKKKGKYRVPEGVKEELGKGVLHLGKGFVVNERGIDRSKVIDIVLPDSYRKGHFWCFGTTRSGKTRLMEYMVEQDIRKGYSVVVVDPKGDNDLMNKIVQVAVEEDRIKDLIIIDPIFPEFSAKVNPLAYYYMPEELVANVVSGIEYSGDTVFFYNVAYEITLLIVQGLIFLRKLEGRKGDLFNLNDIKNYVGRKHLARLKEEIERAVKGLDEEKKKLVGDTAENIDTILRDFDQILSSDEQYYSKISSTLRVALTELTSGNIGRIIGRTHRNLFIERLEEGRRVILLVRLGSLLTQKAAYSLGRVVISMIQTFVGRVFSSGKVVNPPLCIYMDEAQNLLYPAIEDLFAKAGGAGVWVHGFCQTVEQIYSKIGEHLGNSILDNTNTKVFLLIPDSKTASYVVSFFGKVRKNMPLLSVGGQITSRDVEEDVLKTTDVMELKPRYFFMKSYHGKFYGKTADVVPARVEILMPEIKVRE